ncbi:MAG: LptF/LptG family permease [Pseudomonadota bacterium]
MRVIHRRVLSQVGTRALVAVVAFGALATLTQVLNHASTLVDATGGFGAAARLFYLLLPTVMVVVLPFALLVAIVATFDELDRDQTRNVIAMTGCAPGFLFRPVGALAVGIGVFVLLVSVFVEPASNRAIRELQANLRMETTQLIVGDGVLRNVERGLQVVGSSGEDGEIRDVLLRDRREPGAVRLYVAQSARLQVEDGTTKLELLDGTLIVSRPGEVTLINRFEVLSTDLNSFLSPSFAVLGPRQAKTMVLLAAAGAAEMPASVRRELIRRLSDWLYAFGFFGLAFALLRDTGRQQRALVWRLPAILALGTLLRGTGLALLGPAGANQFAAAACFLLPLAAALLPLASWAVFRPVARRIYVTRRALT